MKSLMLFISCFFLSASIYGKEYVAPTHIKNLFANMFPEVEAERVHWEKWNDEVVAIFKDREGLKKAFFSEQGVWRETRQKMNVHQLPIYVQTTLHESYPNMEVTYAGKVYRPQEILYRVESESTEAVIVRLFEEGGTLLSEDTILFSTPRLDAIGDLPILPSRKKVIETMPRVLNVKQ